MDVVSLYRTTTMAAGFAARIPLTNNPTKLGAFITQQLVSGLVWKSCRPTPADLTQFILLSPCAFLAHNYIILPRLAKWLDGEDCLFLSSRKIVRIFVWSDVITFQIQAAGGGMTAGSETMAHAGYWVSFGRSA